MLASVGNNLEGTVGKRLVALNVAVTRLEKKKVMERQQDSSADHVSGLKVNVLKVLEWECI